jgi:N-methylhydantoinase A
MANHHFSIGVDIGGTFTDLVVVNQAGEVYRSKAFTTPDDYPVGILNALERLCNEDLNLSVSELLQQTKVFVNGTTIVTNALAELKGMRVGLLTTQGFKDTLRIARSARTNEFDLQTQVPPPELVQRECIAEVAERVDYSGKAIVSLNEEQARSQIRYLVEEKGVEAIAICFLWSFRNPEHEQRVKALVNEMYPNLFVSVSSDIYPVSREYERMVTTTLNAFTSRGTGEYLASLETRLSERGLKVPVGMIQSTGGITTTQEASQKPISLLNSGPVGGVVAANSLGKELGLKNIITADMGGTSFDTSVILNNEITHIHRARVNRLDTGLSLVDINAIGAGGGSIAWLNEQGLPQVGPKSAGAQPGPVCYNRGGTEPAITDIAVALNFIDPDYFLGGSVKLNKEAALKAIDEKIANPLGIPTLEAAAGLFDLVIANMSNAVRAVSIEKGHDPREFTMISYGGAAALYIAAIAQELGIIKVIIPNNASVFSAYGLLWSDFTRNYVQTVNWNLAQGDINELYEKLTELTVRAQNDLGENGFNEQDIEIVWEGDFKFGTQAFELTIPLPQRQLTENDRAVMAKAFTEEYERLYGAGTSWDGAEHLTILLNVRVTGIGKTQKPSLQTFSKGQTISRTAKVAEREVYLPQERKTKTVSIYKDELLNPGMEISGPAIIESKDTTIYIPENAQTEVDQYGNYCLTLETVESEQKTLVAENQGGK